MEFGLISRATLQHYRDITYNVTQKVNHYGIINKS